MYLLIHGELPDVEQRHEFQVQIRGCRLVHESLIKFYSGFRSDAHPMAIMVGVVGALSSFFNDGLDITSDQSRKHCCFNIIAKMPTLAAMAYKTAVRGTPAPLSPSLLPLSPQTLKTLSRALQVVTPLTHSSPFPFLGPRADRRAGDLPPGGPQPR